jgi:hypothetical protein
MPKKYRAPRKSLVKKTMTDLVTKEHEVEDSVTAYGKNYLKYMRPAKDDICEKYNISERALYALLFINDLKYFTIKYYTSICGGRPGYNRIGLMLGLIKQGLVETYIHAGMLSPSDVQRLNLSSPYGFKKRYRITQLGRNCVKKFYNKLEGREKIYIDDKE